MVVNISNVLGMSLITKKLRNIWIIALDFSWIVWIGFGLITHWTTKSMLILKEELKYKTVHF